MKFLKYLDIRKFSKTNKYYFLFNIVLGVGTLIFFVLTRDTQMQQSLINMLFDQAIELRADFLEWDRECDAKIAAEDIVILSFDDDAVKDFGRLYITPRNKIADMIRFAYEGGASVVVLDMALSDPDYTPSRKLLGDSKFMTGHERDEELFNLLDKIKNDASTNTKILLCGEAHYDNTLKDNKFADLIDNKKIYFAEAAISEAGGSDRTVRFWIPYSVVTAEEDDVQVRQVLWSFELLTLALTEGGEEELEKIGNEILHGNETEFTMHCKSGRDFVFYREIFSENGGIIRDTKSLQYNRIQYVFKPQNLYELSIDKDNIGHWRDNGLDNQDINFTDKIVIIGREDKECNDFFATLIGRIPGMYVHGNAIATVLGKTQPHISSLWTYLIIEIILIVVTAYVFVYWKYRGAKRFVFVLTIVCWSFSYVYFWFTNEFVYLTCSFASMGIYNFVSRMEDFFKKGNLMRSILKKFFRRKNDEECVNVDK